MSRPVRLRSEADLQETVQDYQITFVLFYSTRNASVQDFTSVYNSLCERFSTPDVAFTKMPKEDFPALIDKCGVPHTSVLTLIVFKQGQNVDVVDTRDSRLLERCIENHVRPSPRCQAILAPRCHATVHAQVQPHGRRRGSTEGRPPRPRLVPLRINPESAARLGPNQTMPSSMTYRYPHRGHMQQQPVQLVYRGQADGRPHRASSVHLIRDGNRSPEVTYLDRSGPLAVERTL